jgi:hypothetical protein
VALIDALRVWPAALDDVTAEARLRASLDGLTGAELVALDRAARTSSVLAKQAVRIPTSADVARAQTGALVVISMTRDGRVREAATVRLALDKSALATRALFVRVDDTVPPVRERAADGVLRRVMPERARDFSVMLDLLDSGRTSRATDDGARVRGAVRDLLLSDDIACRAAIDEALRSPHNAIRAAAARFAIGTDEQRTLDVLTRSLDDASPHARVWAARRVLLAETPLSVARKIAPKLSADRLPTVRAIAVAAAARVGATLVLEQLARDGNGGVRALARAKLGRAGGEVEREHVREELGAPGVTSLRAIACLAALSEIGRPEDFGWVAPFLHDARPRVQAEALRALIGVHASGGLEDFVDVLHDKLAHASGRVAFEAARGLALLPRELVRTDVVIARLSQDIRARRLRLALESLV